MKKQFLLVLTLLGAFSFSDVNAAKGMAPLSLLGLLAKIGITGACAERLWKFEQNSKFTKSGRRYAYGFEKIAYLGGASAVLTALWSEDGIYSDHFGTALALTLLCTLTHAVANHDVSVKVVKQVPIVGDILSDYTDEKGEEVCSVGVMSRYLITCAFLRETAKCLTKDTKYDISPYLLDFNAAE